MIESDSVIRKARHRTDVPGVTGRLDDAIPSQPARCVTDQTDSPSVGNGSQDETRSALDKLRVERQRLLNEIQEQAIPLTDHPTTRTHMADDASDIADQMTARALRRHLEELLEEVERAIARAEQGAYGVCERCGGSISPERLQALPSATLLYRLLITPGLICREILAHAARR